MIKPASKQVEKKKGGEGGEKRYRMWEGGSGGRRIYVYIWLIQNAVQQKLIQHRGTIIVKLKKKKEKRWKKRKWHLQWLLLQTYWGDRPSHASLRETHTNFLIKRVDLEALFLFVWGVLHHMTFSPFLARAHWTRNDKIRHRETNPGTGLN